MHLRKTKLEMQDSKKVTFKTQILDENGQMAIFFSTTVVVLVTFIAFIVNIGIFVKAKINLQNATDAAAYAGASVQARQLTNIAYMNWEMRNVYKEWMFKYYVLGNLNIPSVYGAPSGVTMDFKMQSYDGTSETAEDSYNFPSICIDYAETGGIGMCTRYLIPGLPRFESANLLGMDDTTNAFVDALVSEKGLDCSQRTQMNFLTATTWAYNVNINDTNSALQTMTAAAPQMATEFMGAFPQAFELALRIRSLEYQVNAAPMNGICLNASNGVDCNVEASSLTAPSQERALKAYLSGWRNLGSNGPTDTTESDRSFKNSFTLKEISPMINESINSEGSLSTTLIPAGKWQKPYLDLKLMTLNYSTFYTSFTTAQGNLKVGSEVINAEGQCNVTKVGLPVPGYPLGYFKNPDFLTYYAVEGKTKFVGLFNPFTKQVVMKAYAAAKPFGGRIGPSLFDLQQQYVKLRSSKRSSPYISALDTNSFKGTFGESLATGEIYVPGMPLPINGTTDLTKFWLMTDTDAVGGWIEEQKIFYGVPNILWDYVSGDVEDGSIYQASQQLEVISYGDVYGTPQAGLYNKDMFARFKSHLNNIGGTITPEDIKNGVKAIRSPTRYEANNYLIPTPEAVNSTVSGSGTDSWGVITTDPVGDITVDAGQFREYKLELYAPILSNSDPQSLYTGTADIIGVLEQYLLHQERAILKYRNSMNLVAADIYDRNYSTTSGVKTGGAAARVISDLLDSQYDEIKSNPDMANDDTMLPSCKSIAGKFMYFYTGLESSVRDYNDIDCSAALITLLKERWNDPTLTGEIYSMHYTLPLSGSMSDYSKLFTAYRPGAEHDAGSANGQQINAMSGSSDTMIRNFYSTKFIPIKSISSLTSGAYSGTSKMIIYSEGKSNDADTEVKRTDFKNPLNESELSIDINTANH